jgi:hypothetical protein
VPMIEDKVVGRVHTFAVGSRQEQAKGFLA